MCVPTGRMTRWHVFSFNTRLPWLAISLGVLVSCGSGGGNSGLPPTTPSTSYAEFGAKAVVLHNAWDAVAFSGPGTLPASGSAAYAGVMQLTLETGAGALKMDGAMTLTSNFSSNSLSGTARNFVDQNEFSYSGNLAITGGVLNRTANTGLEYTYSAIINGSLSGNAEVFGISGDLSGDFRGLNYGAISGVVAGSATSSFGIGYMFGDFIAEQ